MAESIGSYAPCFFALWGIARNRPREQNLNVLQTSAEMKAGYAYFWAKKFRTAGFCVIIRGIIDEKRLYDEKHLQLAVSKTTHFFLAA